MDRCPATPRNPAKHQACEISGNILRQLAKTVWHTYVRIGGRVGELNAQSVKIEAFAFLFL